MSASLVGSEMCIRDRVLQPLVPSVLLLDEAEDVFEVRAGAGDNEVAYVCLLYTSDAADDM
eukprot:7022824-Alexandrium_andersonii.AAC.1